MTERARYSFRVKESADGTPWISLEPVNGDLSILQDSLLGFDLPENTTFKRAQEIARFIDQNIECVHYTKLP